MKTKQPIKHGNKLDADSKAEKFSIHVFKLKHTNKHVNSLNSSNTTISSIKCTNTVISYDTVAITNAVKTIHTSVVCDGLNMTVMLDAKDQLKFVNRLSKFSGHIKLGMASKMKPYRKGRVIYDGESVIGSIRFDPFGDRAGYFLLHLNPSKLSDVQSDHIQKLVSYLLDMSWCSFVGLARASMFDAAVDVYGVNIKDIIPIPSRAAQSGTFLKFFMDGKTRMYRQCTEYVGHNTSEKHAVVYDKEQEQSELIKVAGKGDVTRVEIQAKPRVRGKFATEISTLADLPRYNNPLRMLSIGGFPKEAANDDLLKLASLLVNYVGPTAVLRLVTQEELRAQIKAYLSNPPCSWWAPDKLWAEFLKVLAEHPLFACCDLQDKPAYKQFFGEVNS